MVPRCLLLSPVSQRRDSDLPIKTDSLNAWQALDVNFKRCDLSKTYLTWKLWSHWRYCLSLFLALHKCMWNSFLSLFMVPVGYRYPFWLIQNIHGENQNQGFISFPGNVFFSFFQINLLVKCLQRRDFTRAREEPIKCKEGRICHLIPPPFYCAGKYRIHGSRGERDWVPVGVKENSREGVLE